MGWFSVGLPGSISGWPVAGGSLGRDARRDAGTRGSTSWVAAFREDRRRPPPGDSALLAGLLAFLLG